MEALLTGAGAGVATALAWKLAAWFFQRDRDRISRDTADLWKELNKVKDEQARIRERVAELPTRRELERLEEKLDAIGDRILEALRTTRH